jgi:hypothetical protein
MQGSRELTHDAVEGPPGVDGRVLGRYRLLARLGEGGCGVVWRARDELLQREVAVKRVSLAADGAGERASREALAAARLAHPAIVALYEACAVEDAFYLISELVRGETLARLIGTRTLADEEVLEIGRALAGALSHAHSRGVIHRDVKPQNVLVPYEPDEAGGVAKLTDFGGARLAGEEVLTSTGYVLGTLAYMSPEQSEGREAGEAADLYALALVLYEALCGVNPVRGTTPAATARRIGRPVAPLERWRPGVPRQLAEALDAALAPAPADRGTLERLDGALEEALEQNPKGATGWGPRRWRRPGAEVADAAQRLEEAATPGPWIASRADPAQGLEEAAPPRAWIASRADAPPWVDVPCQAEASPRGQGPGGLVVTAGTVTAAGAEAPGEAAVGGDAMVAGEALMPGGAEVRGGAESASPAEAPRPLEAPSPSARGARARAARPVVPRAVWLACGLAAVVWQAAAGRPGVALVAFAAILPLAALPRSLRSVGGAPGWLVGGLAPLLGLAGLAGAYPAVAGQARRWRERAALGALGYWWLCLAEPLLARRLWLGQPAGTPARGVWEGSLSGGALHVVGPLLSLGVLLGAAVWAGGSAALPWIVRGRSAARDLAAATSWSVALVLAAAAVGRGLGAHAAHPGPRGAVLGAVLGCLVAVGARALRGPV